jgi:beta-glucosidase
MTGGSAVAFPPGFRWGAATASYQIEGAVAEGGRTPSVWDTFSHTPGKVANGHTGDVACDHYHRVDDDVALMAALGLQAYRFSISWSRVLPEGHGAANQEGLDFYRRLVDRLSEHGITPCATVFHWDLPQVLEDEGGFRNRRILDWYADYAALLARELGDRVTMWATFNEPWVYAFLGHASGVHAPGLTDARAAITVTHHELVAHGRALEAMRAERDGLELGIVINTSNFVAEGEPPPPAEQLARADAIHNRWWFDAMLLGRYPEGLLEAYGDLAADVEVDDLPTIAQPLDWLGINYYFDTLVQGRDADGPDAARGLAEYPTTTGVRESDRRAEHTDMGWPITPEGLATTLRRLAADYPGLPPVYITENGCAYDDPVVDGRCADPRRIEYLDRHLRAVAEAIAAGVDVRGYFQWSLLDNFEWALGYDKRFGLVHVDFDTLVRTPRDSAAWYRDVIARNGLAP